MKIVDCPKGGKMPEGYCRESCLNFPGRHRRSRPGRMGKLKNLFKTDGRSWLQIYKEEIAPSSARGYPGSPAGH